jgi:CHAT domain-containing protein
LELLSQTGVSIDQNTEPALREREKKLRSELNNAYLKSSDRVEDSNQQVRTLEAQYEDVKNKIRAGNFKYASLVLPATFDLSEVKRGLLDSNTAILEYSLGEQRSFLWVITSESLKTYELPPRTQLEAELKSLIQTLISFGPDAPVNSKRATPRELENAYWKQAERVSSLIFRDALTQTSARRLVIVADGVLESAPFAALTKPGASAGSPAEPRPLIGEFEIVNLPSISVMTVLERQVAQRQPASRSVAVFADPVFEPNDSRIRQNESMTVKSAKSASTSHSRTLDRALRGSSFETGIRRLVFSRREAEAISSVAPGAFVALDFRANRTAAIGKELANYRIVHFATHGILNNKHPELSGILLSMFDEKGKPQEGFLQLSDIYNLNLPAELIVLSACETGLGKSVEGEGLIGLTRGFMYAGAARVLGSLWKVDDAATAALMANFYKELIANEKRPADALRAAQLQLFQQKRWRSPYYWAGFVLQGDWR